MTLFIVKAALDREAGVWYVAESDVPGLVTEAKTFDELCAKIPVMAAELLELNGWESGTEVAIEIIGNATSKVKLAAA